jgi:hypothetical protein
MNRTRKPRPSRRRLVPRSLAAGAVVLTLGVATAPTASAVSHSVPTPPVRMYPITMML